MTDEEVMKALIEGKKLTLKGWKPDEYIYLKEGFLDCDSGGEYLGFDMNAPWKIWKPEPRKVSTEIYIDPAEVDSTSLYLYKKLGIGNWHDKPVYRCTTKVRITLEEIAEDEE